MCIIVSNEHFQIGMPGLIIELVGRMPVMNLRKALFITMVALSLMACSLVSRLFTSATESQKPAASNAGETGCRCAGRYQPSEARPGG